jgi:FAD dependent oxidoreductase TIGR03364
VRLQGLKAALWSPTETCVDPREVIAGLPKWLKQTCGVEFRFGVSVTGYSDSRVWAGGERIAVDHLWVCSGDEMQTLFPDCYARFGVRRCKLQMMRSQPYGDRYRLGPMLAAGSTLRHYPSFGQCPSLPALRERFAREMPQFDRFGIHVMAAQNGLGEVVIGDSHEYDDAIEPFDKPEIDALILDYLRTFVDVPDLRIAARWHGVYVKHPTDAYQIAQPTEGVTIIGAVGGAGMTLSFAIAEQAVKQFMGR